MANTWREAARRREVRRIFARAVHSGKVKKPDSCEVCGRQPGKVHLHGHHTDYSRPLEVRWLCRGCHDEEHRR